MPLSALTGTRLRERRLVLGLRQSVVAERAGISASYLNLIEHNRRAVGLDLLNRLGDALGLEREALTPGSDAVLFEGLRMAVARAGGDEGEAGGAELDRLADFVSRFPGWAGMIVALDRRSEALERTVEALNDRMTHDPHLSQSLHELLSALSSVRATAEILAETRDLSPDWSERFHRNLHKDSERLAVGAEALVTYLDTGSGKAEQGIGAPQDEVEDWLRAMVWSEAGLRTTTADLRQSAGALASSAARALAEAFLDRADADAAIVPREDLIAAVGRTGPDPFTLAEGFGCDPLVIMRGLASLPAFGAGLVVCDASGTFTFRKPALGFPLPRFGAACPLWPLYQALGHPNRPIEAWVEMSGQGGGPHRVFAWSVVEHPSGPRGAELRLAGMLILPQEVAGGSAPNARAVAVGSSCRVCPRHGCVGRREPSILSPEDTT